MNIATTLLLACASAAPPTPSGGPVFPVLDEARAWLGVERHQLLERLLLPGSALQQAAYGPSKGLEMAYAPAKSPARLYLADGKVVLAYLSGAPAATITPDALASAHPGATALPSRAGKPFEHHVDAPAGIAWSDDGQEVAFIEVFAPISLPAWKARFYDDPGTFYK